MRPATMVSGPLVVEPAGVGRFVVTSDHSRYTVHIAPPACPCAGFAYRRKCRHVTAGEAYAETRAQDAPPPEAA